MSKQDKQDKEDAKALRKKHAEPYIRIGTTFYKKTQTPIDDVTWFESLDPWTRECIVEDSDGDKKVFEEIPKFDGFAYVPMHTDFKRRVHNHYNRYEPLPFTPVETDVTPDQIPNSLKMLRHIFGDKYEIGLDYVTLLFRNPLQQLPILCLVSRENNTGKSTFGKWLNEIFGKNVLNAGNADIGEKHNEFLVGKLCVIIDEGLLEKQSTKEYVKRLSTETRLTVNPKGRPQYEANFFGKFIFISNHEDSFIRIEDGETRWFVLKVPTLGRVKKDSTEQEPTKGKDTPEVVNFLGELIKEIPSFLKYITDRELFQPEPEGRMWFTLDNIRTNALGNVVETSRPTLEKEIRNMVREEFMDLIGAYRYKIENVNPLDDPKNAPPIPIALYYSVKDVVNNLAKIKLNRYDTTYVKKTMELMGIKIPLNPIYGEYFTWTTIYDVNGNELNMYETQKKRDRFAKLLISDFFTPEELNEIIGYKVN